MALDVGTARKIVELVSTDHESRAAIVGPDFPAFLSNTLERLRWSGGARNLFLNQIARLEETDMTFIRVSCTGIAERTQKAIDNGAVRGAIPKVRDANYVSRSVNGFAHNATAVWMKDGNNYVFDWWPTLNPSNPIISRRTEWNVAHGGVEFRLFKGFA
ncbi:MAG: hypothetical protein QM756_19160 [Polyangiaceae bacterium]